MNLAWFIPLFLFLAQYLKYKSLHFFVDFSHWMQVISHIASIGMPLAPNQDFIVPGTLNYFAAHFTPLVYVFGLVYKLVPSPATVIALNVAVMVSSIIPLYMLAVRKEGTRQFGKLAAALLLLYPTFQYITLYEFEMLRFSIPILLWMLYFFEARRFVLYGIFAAFAVLVREEVGLTVAAFGIYALIFARRRKEGLVAIILGLGGFWIISSIAMPLFRGEGTLEHIAAGLFGAFGRTPWEVVKGVLLHPLIVAKTIFVPVKLANTFMLGLPLLFAPLLAPVALLGAIPAIGVGLLSNSFAHSSYMLYYVAPAIPFIFYAFIHAWKKMIVRFAAATITNTLIAGILVSNVFFGLSPISLQFWFKNIQPAPFRTQNFHWSVYKVNEHHRRVEKFVAMIPGDAIVSAPQFLHPRLYKKRGTLVFPALESKDGKWSAEYVLLDTTNNELKSQSPAYVTKEEMTMVRGSDEWQRIASDDGYELYIRL